MVFVVAPHYVGEGVTAGEGGAKNYAGIVTHGVWQSPAVRQLGAFGRGLIAHDQRDASVTQRVDSRADSQASNTVEGSQVFRRNAEFTSQIESTPATRQFDDIRHIVNGFKRGLSLFALNQAQDVLVQHVLAEVRWDGADELIAAQDAFDVAVVEDALGSRQAPRPPGYSPLGAWGWGVSLCVYFPTGLAGESRKTGAKVLCPLSLL